MKLKKRILSVLLVLAVMVTFMPAVTLTANAASKKTSKKVYLVSSEKNEIGDNTKYTYNKKGFVTKAVSKYTSKDSDSDSVETVTTTYKYNKKNKITKKTTTDVNKVTTYKTNQTTGKATSESLGTVTTTTKDETVYTYKNGRAVKAVTTSTTVKSGSVKDVDVSLNLSDYTELSNGSYIAGFNERNADGSWNDEDSLANAYYYTGNIKAAESKGTRTTTYKDNGNGTYTVTENYVSDSSNYTTTPKEVYYRMDDNGNYVVCTDKEKENEDWEFSRTESVDVAVNANGSGDSYSSTDTETITDQSVTTTTFKYDKKKRVKQANISTVSTDASSVTETENRTYTEKDSEEVYDEATDDDKMVDYTTTDKRSSSYASSSSTTETTSQVETYTYNKNNRKTKKVVTDKGVMNKVETYVDGRSNSTEESQTVYSDGKSASYKETRTYSGDGDTTTTVYSNGTRTTTTTDNPYTLTVVENSANRSGRTRNTETKDEYTFFKNGGRMIHTVEKESTKYSDGTSYIDDSENTRYEYDKTGDKYSYTWSNNETYTPADGAPSVSQRTNSYYNDGTTEKEYYSSYKYDDDPTETTTDDAVKKAAEDANAALLAYGTPYTETKSKSVAAKPSKATTNYKYDKQGNLKSAKTSGSWAESETLRNETYGNTIYQAGADNKLEAVETVVNHTYKNNRTKENTVKDGSNRVKSAMTVGTRSEDRATPNYYTVDGRVTYTLKSKTIAKKTVREAVELQQWILQNPGCGSAAGVF